MTNEVNNNRLELRKRQLRVRPSSSHTKSKLEKKNDLMSLITDINMKSSPMLKEIDKQEIKIESPKVSNISHAQNTIIIKRTALTAEREISIDNQKKKADKHRDNNLDILLMNKHNYDLKIFMGEYNRRQGLSEGSKVFIVTGQFDFIRRELKSRGWIENKHTNSQAFHLKWSFSDSDNDYKVLRPGQLFNHFLNNRELTTKSGLLKNLRNVCEHNVSIDKFFPRCYDLGDNVQVREFTNDFQNTAIINIIKKHAIYYQSDNSLQPVNLRLLSMSITHTQDIIYNILDKCEKLHSVVCEDFNYNSYIRDEDMKSLLEYSEMDLPVKNVPKN